MDKSLTSEGKQSAARDESRDPVQDESLADRLTNYADGLVAATFVFMSGIGASVGDDDMRCSLADAYLPTIVVSLVGGAVILLTLRWLRLWADRLRAGTKVSVEVSLVRKRLDFVRILLVCLFIAGACALLSTLADEKCMAVVDKAA